MQKGLKKISRIIGNNFEYKKALFAISSLGLGHATRTLPIIKYYLKKDFYLTIISHGNTLYFLKKELRNYNKKIYFLKLKDYPSIERGTGIKFYLYLIWDALIISKKIQKEHIITKKLGNKFDFIFSDGRYGIYNKKIPSYLLSHQISFQLPSKISFLTRFVDHANYKFLRNFSCILIPDYKEEKKSLAGLLSHSNILNKIKHHYIGILTSYYNLDKIYKDIDYYFIISGYLLEHKESFVSNLVEQAKKLNGKKVFVLGNNLNDYKKQIKKYNISIYSSISSKKRIEFFNRAKIIISRSGYTTIMDLIANNKKAILFPTKNQTEQEYLAKYLDKKGLFINGGNTNFDLKKLSLKIK